jgi:hypothetical protein
MKGKVCLTGMWLGTNHGCITTNPNQSVVQCNRNIPVHIQPKSLRLCHQLGRLFIPFWDSQGIVLDNFQKRGENVNSASYSEVMLKLWDAFPRKRPGQLARGVLLHQENIRSHIARATQERIQELQWELLNVRLTTRSWPLVTSICPIHKKPSWWQKFRWWWRGWNGGAGMAETTGKKLLCCGFRRTGKFMGQVY